MKTETIMYTVEVTIQCSDKLDPRMVGMHSLNRALREVSNRDREDSGITNYHIIVPPRKDK